MSNIAVFKPTKFMLAQSMRLEGMRVLDFGCGPGVISMLLAKRAREVVGVDHWEERIISARQQAIAQGIDNVRFEWLDARDFGAIQALGDFDVVVCWGVLHRVSDHVALLHLLARLAPVMCLEWHAPVFPFASQLRLGYFPRSKSLDHANLLGDASEKEQADSKFWCPSIGAVEEILAPASFTNKYIIGIGEHLRGTFFGTVRACLGALKRLISDKTLLKVPVARVYVTYTKEDARLEFDVFPEWAVEDLPDWIRNSK